MNLYLIATFGIIIVSMGIFQIPAYITNGMAVEDSVLSGDREIPFSISYSRKRKTLVIIVHRDQVIEVKAPAGFPIPAIREIVRKKSPWILKKLAGFAISGTHRILPSYTDGEVFFHLGHPMTLAVVRTESGLPVRLVNTVLEVSVPGDIPENNVSGYVKNQVTAWYRSRAIQIIGERLSHFSVILDIPMPQFRVRNTRKRWGSCSCDNHLSFNLKLVMAPLEQIDYVVLHEMCHIIHKDHQKQFWSAVNRVMPDYKKRKALLKRDGWRYVL